MFVSFNFPLRESAWKLDEELEGDFFHLEVQNSPQFFANC